MRFNPAPAYEVMAWHPECLSGKNGRPTLTDLGKIIGYNGAYISIKWRDPVTARKFATVTAEKFRELGWGEYQATDFLMPMRGEEVEFPMPAVPRIEEPSAEAAPKQFPTLPVMEMPKTAARTKKTGEVEVVSYEHDDKRLSIPTQETSHLAPENGGKKTYAFDPSLDPQLVWTGKEEQPVTEVDTVPLFVQEIVNPEKIVHRMKAWNEEESDQIRLFGYKNDISDILGKKFYAHERGWSNRMILGDSLLVMNSLLEKENMAGKVQCVYIDPPYGIKFGSNWQVSTKKRDVKDKEDDLTRQPEQIKAFRDTWELGIHSYLSYLRDRLTTVRELLTESGSCFVQISDENVHLVRNLMDEIFGPENFVCLIPYITKSMPLWAKFLDTMNDYIIWYWKNKEFLKFRQLYKEYKVEGLYYWNYLQLEDSSIRRMTKDEISNHSLLPKNSEIARLVSIIPPGYNEKAVFPITVDGVEYTPPRGKSWISSNQDAMRRLVEKNRLYPSWKSLTYFYKSNDFPYQKITNFWTDTGTGNFTDDKIYVVQTGSKVIERCLLMTTDPGDLVLDPTCGSGTTAFVSEQWGRRWITTDTSRVALALARTRLMTSTFPYYPLKNEHDIREGFLYKTVPHITLKSLANDLPPEEEILYDQPKVDKNVVRVSGPFTIESLSPHRSRKDQTIETSEDFVTRVIENLRRSGVQTGVKEERLTFNYLDLHAAKSFQAIGEYLENGEPKRVAVAIGPEFGSIDDDFIRDAIKDAGKYCDLLVVAGVSFDGSAFMEEVPDFIGKLRLIKAKINPDISMGDILKKTGTGNLFLAFWEPDIALSKTADGQYEIEVKGVDVYDATTGQIRSGGTDDIACWFIDTNYDEESFVVEHAYFVGADKPYEKLKKALKAEIDEELWERLYTNRSRPFRKSKTGKIAVKVINHYGDEVMKVVAVW